jgi:hypothetical protein
MSFKYLLLYYIILYYIILFKYYGVFIDVYMKYVFHLGLVEIWLHPKLTSKIMSVLGVGLSWMDEKLWM